MVAISVALWLASAIKNSHWRENGLAMAIHLKKRRWQFTRQINFEFEYFFPGPPIKLPPSFQGVELFPAVSMWFSGNKIEQIVDKNRFKYDLSKHLSKQQWMDGRERRRMCAFQLNDVDVLIWRFNSHVLNC